MTKRKTIRILAKLKVPTAMLTTSVGRVGSKDALEVPADEAESYIANGVAERAPEEQIPLPAPDDVADDDASESD